MEEGKTEVEMELEHPKFIYLQRKKDEKGKEIMYRKLSYDYKRCVGCGICVELCPKKAMELGPMPEIATGLDAPPVMIDIENCNFCGFCASVCPERAIEFLFFREELEEEKDICSVEGLACIETEVNVDESCVFCQICEKVCPKKAIDVKTTGKEELIPFDRRRKGEIKIDREKCNLCGACAKFCSAFLMVEKEVNPEDSMPFSDIFFDEGECDYCGLCEGICPERAIEVTADNKKDIKDFDVKKEIHIEGCNGCGWCVSVCPYDAISLRKPFEGSIKIIEEKLEECDPQGCHACINICPCNAWYIPSDGKIAVGEDLCIFCGACKNACRLGVIEVDRKWIRGISFEKWLHRISSAKKMNVARDYLRDLLSELSRLHS